LSVSNTNKSVVSHSQSSNTHTAYFSSIMAFSNQQVSNQATKYFISLQAIRLVPILMRSATQLPTIKMHSIMHRRPKMRNFSTLLGENAYSKRPRKPCVFVCIVATSNECSDCPRFIWLNTRCHTATPLLNNSVVYSAACSVYSRCFSSVRLEIRRDMFGILALAEWPRNNQLGSGLASWAATNLVLRSLEI